MIFTPQNENSYNGNKPAIFDPDCLSCRTIELMNISDLLKTIYVLQLGIINLHNTYNTSNLSEMQALIIDLWKYTENHKKCVSMVKSLIVNWY